VVLDDASYLGRITKAAMLRHRIEYEVALSGTQILAIRQIVIEGGGMAWLPASLVAEDLEAHRLVRVRRDFPSIPFTIHAARQPFPLSPDHEAVWEKLKEFGEAGRVLDFGEALR
jgi:DNA-binding transcriptional LysR family regulator